MRSKEILRENCKRMSWFVIFKRALVWEKSQVGPRWCLVLQDHELNSCNPSFAGVLGTSRKYRQTGHHLIMKSFSKMSRSVPSAGSGSLCCTHLVWCHPAGCRASGQTHGCTTPAAPGWAPPAGWCRSKCRCCSGKPPGSVRPASELGWRIASSCFCGHRSRR